MMFSDSSMQVQSSLSFFGGHHANSRNANDNMIFEQLGFEMPKVIKGKWTNNLYQNVKPMLNDKSLAYNLPEFKSSSYLKGFGSETIKWINNGSNGDKSKLLTTTKLFSSRSFIAENPNRSQSTALQPTLQPASPEQRATKIDTVGKQQVNKTRFSYNLERKNSKIDFFENNSGNSKNISQQQNQNNKKIQIITRNPVYDPTTSLALKQSRDRLTFDGKIHIGGPSKLNRQTTIYEKRNPFLNGNSKQKVEEEFDNNDYLIYSSEDDLLEKYDVIGKSKSPANAANNGFINSFEDMNHQQHQLAQAAVQTPRSSMRTLQPEMGRAKLKCKTPIHYATDKRISDMKTPGPSPLKTPRMSRTPKIMKRINPDEQRKKELEKLFAKLDLDEDGHLSFELIENIFCKNLNNAQYSYVKQIYNVLSDSTFFGVQEFKTFILLLEVIMKQKYRSLNSVCFNVDEEDSLENFWEHFMQTDFEDYHKEIMEYIKLIDSLDLIKKLNVLEIMKTRFKSMDADKLVKALTQHFDSQFLYLQLNYTIKGGDNLTSKILNYISLIPLFIYIESIIKNKVIFKRRQNTILNLKDATNLHNFNRRLFE